MSPSKAVAIIMGSRSDWPTMKGAAESLDSRGGQRQARGGCGQKQSAEPFAIGHDDLPEGQNC